MNSPPGLADVRRSVRISTLDRLYVAVPRGSIDRERMYRVRLKVSADGRTFEYVLRPTVRTNSPLVTFFLPEGTPLREGDMVAYRVSEVRVDGRWLDSDEAVPMQGVDL